MLLSGDREISISVITAVWNRVDTIEDCLKSFKAQTYVNKEQIVIDGESIDGTINVLNAYKNQLSVLVSERDQGIYDALNKGIAASNSDVIGFLHADDVYASTDVLSKVAKAFRNPEVSAVFGNLQYVSKDDLLHVVRNWNSCTFHHGMLSYGWMPPHPTLYVRREWYKKINGFDLKYKISADYLSVLQLFSNPGFNSVYLPMVFIKMRVGGVSNSSIRNILKKSSEDLMALNDTKVGGIFALALKNLRKIHQFFK